MWTFSTAGDRVVHLIHDGARGQEGDERVIGGHGLEGLSQVLFRGHGLLVQQCLHQVLDHLAPFPASVDGDGVCRARGSRSGQSHGI